MNKCKAKICYGSTTKEIELPSTIEELTTQAFAALGESIKPGLKFFYYDKDKDLIAVENSNDYTSLLEESKGNAEITLFIAENSKEILKPIKTEVVKTENLTQQSSTDTKRAENTEVKEEVKKQSIVEMVSNVAESVLIQSPPAVVNVENKEIIEDEYKCLFCNGTKLNKKGKQCTKCEGTGKMGNEWKQRMEKMVEQGISKMFKNEIERQASQIMQSIKVEDILKASHISIVNKENFNCNLCNQAIGKSTKFVCGICPNYVLCEKCEHGQEHEHPLVKYRGTNPIPTIETKISVVPQPEIRTPENKEEEKKIIPEPEPAPAHSSLPFIPVIEVSSYKSIENQFEEIKEPVKPVQKFSLPKNEIGPEIKNNLWNPSGCLESIIIDTHSVVCSQLWKPPEKKKKEDTQSKIYKIRYEDESTIARNLEPGQEFTKTWCFVNDGKTEWPKNIELVPIGENIFQAQVSPVPIAKPGKKSEVEAKMIAPQYPGRHRQFFEMRIDGMKVGNKVWAEILVGKGQETSEKKMEEQKKTVDVKNATPQKKNNSYEKLTKMKETILVPEEYEKNLLYLMENSEEDPEWILNLLKANGNRLDRVKDIVIPSS